jgi:tetratricopeptide (TPR) repeat protein
MAIDQRDFFISFNSADLAYAEAIDAALRAAGFTTHFHPRDLGAGGNIPVWMDEALMGSAQTLALYSPDYMKDTAIYSRAERYASWWQDPGDDRRKLIPVLLRDTKLTPLMAPISRIEVTGLTPKEAAARVVDRLKAPNETEQRGRWHKLQALPKIFRAPYRPNPNFTGRFEDLERLHRALGEPGTVAVTAIAGTGGIGKTTLAAEYCHRFGGQYGGMWTIRSEEMTVMLADLQELANELKVGTGKNTESDAKAALNHLKSEIHPWLLVYDNAPNPDSVRKWLPEGTVRSLITSRFAEFGDLARVMPLDYWPEQVTTEYLLSRSGRNDVGGATRLARILGGLPLAAEPAATYLRPRAGVRFDDYAGDLAHLIKRPRPAGATGEYSDTVYAAFVKSLETLSEMERGEIALDVLRFCAFLSPDGVDLWILTVKWGHDVLPGNLALALADKSIQEDALAALNSLSLLRRENGPFGPMLIFHRLLLEVVRDWMGESARALWGEAAVRLVAGQFPYDPGPSNWLWCARIMPHIASLVTNNPRSEAARKALGRLLNQASIYLDDRGNREGAMQFAQQAVELARTIRTESLNLAAGLNNLGNRYFDVDMLDEAEKAYREAREIQEPQLNSNDPSLAVTFSNLAGVHWRRKQFAQAEPLYLRATEIMQAHDANSPEYSTALSNLGALYGQWAGEPGQASRRTQEKEYKLREFAICLNARGPRHPETAISHANLAVMKEKMQDWRGAAVDAERAVAIMLSLDLSQHPHARVIMSAVIRYRRRSGQRRQAARLERGDMSDLRPVIAQIEAEHRAWVAKDPKNRNFGPPSPFGPSPDDMAKFAHALAEAGVGMQELMRRVQSGELSEADALKMLTEKLAGRSS